MAKLVINKNGVFVKDLILEDDQTYSIGRDPQSDISIDDGIGISRKHCEVFFEDSRWIVTLNSKYGHILYEGDEVQGLELEEGVVFSIPPYSFQFEKNLPDTKAKGTSSKGETALSPFEGPLATDHSSYQQSTKGPDDTLSGTGKSLVENTTMEKRTLTPYLTIIDPDKKEPEIIELSGQGWTIGRDPSCEVSIRNGHMSRRHFDLTRTKTGYYITDLESANGTIINEDTLSPLVPSAIHSGDSIRIMDLLIRFEVRDKNFEKRLAVLPDNNLDSLHAHMFAQLQSIPQGEHNALAHPSVLKMPSHMRHGKRKRKHKKKNRIRIGIGLVLFILILSQLENQDEEKDKITETSSTSISIEELSPTKRKEVEHHLYLAQSHFQRGKYELCMSEINKIHTILPPFETSSQLGNQCEQGSVLQKQIKIRQQREEEELKIKQEVKSIVKKCSALMSKTLALADMERCLFKVRQLDPGNLKASQLIDTINNRENNRLLLTKKRAEASRKIRLGVSKYRKAKGLSTNGQLRKSIIAYKAFLASYMPDPGNYRSKAKREMASIEKKLTAKVRNRLKDCNAKLEKAAFKAAIESCNLALSEDPSNTEAKGLKTKVISNMRRYMKAIYEDSVLEESFGNIEAAKIKWRQILSEDIRTDSFFVKATLKLKKYGEGI